MTSLAYFEGSIVPIEQASVSIMCNTLHYGTGCFGGLRGYWNEEHGKLYAFRLHDHYVRLLNSAKLLRCDLDYTPEKLVDITVDLLAQEAWTENCYIRPMIYKDDGVFRVWVHDATDKLCIFSMAAGSYIKGDTAAKVCVSGWRRIDDTMIPARGKLNGAYVNSAIIKCDAMLSGFDDALVLNQDGHVSEGSAANFMVVRDGVLITSPITDNILEGITRRTLIQLAREELGFEVAERSIDRSELYLCDEAFYCGTGAQVKAIGSIDHHTIGTGSMGPMTQELHDLFFRVVSGRESKYIHWLSEVPSLKTAQADS